MSSSLRRSSGRKTDDDAAAHATAQPSLRRSSYTEASAAQPGVHLKRQAPAGSGLRRPMSYDSLQALDLEPETSPKYNQHLSNNPFAQQAIGALTACFLAGGAVQDMVEDPELGMLIASGQADMVSSQVCRPPTAVGMQQESGKILTGREAPEVFSRAHEDRTSNVGIIVDDEQHSMRIASVGVVGGDDVAADSLLSPTTGEGESPASQRASSQSNDSTKESPLIEFLRANDSPKADEASCLASSNLQGEARNARCASSITRYLRAMATEDPEARLVTSELLSSMEEDGLIARGRQAISRRTAQRTVPPSPC